MICPDCNGNNPNCSNCNGGGEICDVCGEATNEPGKNVCGECEEEEVEL